MYYVRRRDGSLFNFGYLAIYQCLVRAMEHAFHRVTRIARAPIFKILEFS